MSNRNERAFEFYININYRKIKSLVSHTFRNAGIRDRKC